MKRIILYTFLAVAGSYCAGMAQSYDPNYKHQTGKIADTTFDYITVREKAGVRPDANYKHQVGKKQNHQRGLIIPAGRKKIDANYKHQFPSR
jgi:hypothetical protein